MKEIFLQYTVSHNLVRFYDKPIYTHNILHVVLYGYTKLEANIEVAFWRMPSSF